MIPINPSPLSDLDRALRTLIGGAPEPAAWQPHLDIVERDEHYVVIVDLPGVARDEVDLTVADSTVTISGIRHRRMPGIDRADSTEHDGTAAQDTAADASDDSEASAASDGARLHGRFERPVGAFRRVVRVPRHADTAGIDATLADGQLVVRIPKTDASQLRHVPIG